MLGERIESQFCPHCRHQLLFYHVTVATWPYIHCDLMLICPGCKNHFFYGIPADRLSGLELHIWGVNKYHLLERALKHIPPPCPFHKIPMVLTKIYDGRDDARTSKNMIQFKCPTCYLTRHFPIPK